MDARTLRVVVVPHTHWDREWYRTHEQFRVRLVALVDALLDLLERDPAFRHFMLDGQTIVVDDYLEVRPNARRAHREAGARGTARGGTLARAARRVAGLGRGADPQPAAGALQGGRCWAGRCGSATCPTSSATSASSRSSSRASAFLPPYCGAASAPTSTARSSTWEGPDGTRIPVVYLMHGYGNAVNLPTDPAALAARIEAKPGELAKHSDVSTLLFMNGSDHERPNPALPRALEAVRALLSRASTSRSARSRSSSRARSKKHRRPCRAIAASCAPDCAAPLLPGCASARASQKLREFENDRLLTRYLEPLAAWLGALGGDADRETIAFAWRVALENHPHDSVCGCSIDAVHAQMETRYDRVAEIAGTQLERVSGGARAPASRCRAPGSARALARRCWSGIRTPPGAAASTPRSRCRCR